MTDAELEGLAFLVSDEFEEILAKAMTSPAFAIDDDDPNNEVWMGCAVPADVVWTSEDGHYRVVAGDADVPIVVLMHGPEPVGYYAEMGAWVADDHRGRDLGTEMILAAAKRYGRGAFIPEGRPDPREGLGFSEVGLAVLERAARRAGAALAYLGSPSP